MTILIIIIVGAVIIIAFKFGTTSGRVIENVASSGGMREKYAKLLEHILEGHPESTILVETRTYIRAGVSNYGGTTLFHLQQDVGHRIIIQYEIKNNPLTPNWQLEWVFPDDLDQDVMMIRMAKDIENKSRQMIYKH